MANSTNVGYGGDIYLKANDIIQLQDREKISVDGGIKGGSGNINLNANKIDLAQKSSISAKVNLGNEGNIFLTANNLFLDDLTQITTNSIGNSTGGNIAINLQDNLLMMADSKIIATSVNGQGGNIQIQTTGFFPSLNSAIDASSKFGINGTVQIDTPNLDPNSGLIKLPDTPIDPNLYLTKGCGLRSNASFINLGRGGLSENPFNTVVDSVVLPDIKIPSKVKPLSLAKLSFNSTSNNVVEDSIIEAEAWKINQQGNIELVAVSQKNNFNNFSDRKC